MLILTNKQVRTIIAKLSDLQIAVIKTNDRELERNNYLSGMAGYTDISYGIRDIVGSIAGKDGYEQFAAKVLPYIANRG